MESLKSAIRASGKTRALFSPAVAVADRTELSPGYTRITLTGGSLAEYRDCCPADGFKLMLDNHGGAGESPHRGEDGLPTWEGAQPVLRALTVRSFDEDRRTITTDIARHDHGVLAQWLEEVVPGDVVRFSGMRREWALPSGVDRAVLIADAAGIPAAASVVESLPPGFPADLVVHLQHEEDVRLIPSRDDVAVHVVDPASSLEDVHGGLLPHLQQPQAAQSGRKRVQGWIAAETSAVHHLRTVMKNCWSIAGDDMLARAYWTAGMDGTRQDEADIVKFRRAVSRGGDVHDPALAERVSLGE